MAKNKYRGFTKREISQMKSARRTVLSSRRYVKKQKKIFNIKF